MTQLEIDQLVREIGDELLQRLGPQSGLAKAASSPSCGCSQCAAAQNETPAGKPAEVNGIGFQGSWIPPKEGIAGLIDHTLLRPEATEAEIVQLCGEAKRYRFAAVCVQPCWLARVVRELRGAKVKACTVIGFPHGATLTPVKCAEAEQALKLGARELDMVVHIGALKSGDLDVVFSDIRAVVDLARRAEACVKVILEMPLLTETEKIHGAALARLAGAAFVKTSTGFGPAGADPRDVALLKRVVGSETGIKAAGGIRSYPRLQQMMAAGATRIGASASVKILEEAASRLGTAAPSGA